MNFLLFMSAAFLLLILFSDVTKRRIPLIYLIGEAMLSLCIVFCFKGLSALKPIMMNFVVVAVQLLMLRIWIKMRNSKSQEGLWSKFGEGDLVMLIISAINFSMLNFLSFVIVTSLFAIIIFMGASAAGMTKGKTIPFAGFLAAGLILIRICQLFGNRLIFYSDNTFLNFIYGTY